MMQIKDINLYLNYDSSMAKCAKFACLISACLIKKTKGSLTN